MISVSFAGFKDIQREAPTYVVQRESIFDRNTVAGASWRARQWRLAKSKLGTNDPRMDRAHYDLYLQTGAFLEDIIEQACRAKFIPNLVRIVCLCVSMKMREAVRDRRGLSLPNCTA